MQEEGAEGHFVYVCVCVSNRGIKWDRQTGFSDEELGLRTYSSGGNMLLKTGMLETK